MQHPFFPATEKEKVKAVRADQLLEEYNEDRWLEFVPKQSPRGVCPSPVPGYEYSMAWEWDPHSPNQIRCAASGVVFPNDKYPPVFLSVKVLSGKTVEVPYWQTNNFKQTKAGITLVQGQINCSKRNFLVETLPLLATRYEATGDERFARRVVLTFDAWATYVPDYFITRGWNQLMPLSPEEAEEAGWVVERASTHNGFAHELNAELIAAYDRVRSSEAFACLSEERGYDVRAHIEKNFFGNILDYLIERIPMKALTATNLSTPYVCAAQTAIMLNRPDVVQWLDRYLSVMIPRNFMRDGMYPESFLYHKQYAVANFEVCRQIRRYFEVYPPAAEGMKIIEARMEKRLAFLQKAIDAVDRVSFPDGDMAPFSDTSMLIMVRFLALLKLYDSEVPPSCDTTEGGPGPRSITESQLLPSYGHLTLGDGKDHQQVQMNFTFYDNANHCHQDTLSYTLYGFGRELIGDIRYSKIPGRGFGICSMGHNTVVINQKTQYAGTRQEYGNAGHLFTGGTLTLFEPGLKGIAAAEVNGERSYPEVAERYQRMLLLNTIDPEHPYVVDLFKVKGGQTHDYFLHGSTKFEQTAGISIDLEPIRKEYPLLGESETWEEPRHETETPNWYGMFREMSTGRSPGNWDMTLADAETGRGHTRLFMADDGDVQVYLGKSPAPYRDKPPKTFYDHWRPSLMVRHQDLAAESLESVFAGVVEPLNSESVIRSVEKLPVMEEDSDFLALRVLFVNGREDVYLINWKNYTPEEPQDEPGTVRTADGAFALEGKVGIYTRSGSEIRSYLISGRSFEAPQKSIHREKGFYSGAITGVCRKEEGAPIDAFITDAVLPEDGLLNGRWLAFLYGSLDILPDAQGHYPLGIKEQKGLSQMYWIRSVERVEDKTYIHLEEDPMLSVEGGCIRELMRPHRKFEGLGSFKIDVSSCE